MKRLTIITALLLCAVILIGCGGNSADTTGSGHDEESLTGLTEAPVTEPEIPEPDVTKTLEYACSPVYHERITEKNGTASFGGKVRLNIEYESTFYGHESVVNRDYTRYGSRFEYAGCSALSELKGDLAGVDLDGDSYAEILNYEEGELYVYKLTMKRRKTQVYNIAINTAFSAELAGSVNVGGGLKLCGAGDMDGDGYNDLLFCAQGYAVVYYGGEKGFEAKNHRLDFTGTLRCGDTDGDGVYDIIDIGDTVRSYTVKDGRPVLICEGKPSGAPADNISGVYAADINSDGLCDIVYTVKDNGSTVCSFFGRGDGRYGSYEQDGDNKNLYSVFTSDRIPINIMFADLTGNGAYDIAGVFESKGNKKVGVMYSIDEPAYDYSIYGMHVNGEYRVYSGARWSDANLESGDGDHVILTVSNDGKTWRRYIDSPMFLLGYELGESDWWTSNTLEPEVIYADGKYHMYWQCTYTTPKGNYGDKIGYASSEDGIHWDRKTDEAAIICSDPEIGFNHEEVLYVADDPDGKPYWLYTGHFVKGQWSGYIRIRSSVPDRFLYEDRESTDGFSQIGNQLAYFTAEDGRRIFIRITFDNAKEEDGNTYWRPTLYMSDDGKRFTAGKNCTLAGVDVTDPKTENNRNMFFLGLVTENGTGEILRNEDGTYTLMYLATTCASSVAPEIFDAEVGYGVMTFTTVK